MKRLEEVYHYTSPEGLVSIFKNKTFRFTDCQFFNDKLEYNYIKSHYVWQLVSWKINC